MAILPPAILPAVKSLPAIRFTAFREVEPVEILFATVKFPLAVAMLIGPDAVTPEVKSIPPTVNAPLFT